MAQALVQSAVDATTPGTSVTVSSADGWAAPTLGNAILAVLGLAASVGTPSIDVAMSEVFAHTQGTALSTLAELRVATGSGEGTFVGSSTNSDNLRFILGEFSGLFNAIALGTPVEQESAAATSLGSGATYTAPVGDTLVITVCAIGGIPGGSGPAAPSGFTLLTPQSNTRLHVAYALDQPAGSYNPTWTWSNSLAAHVITFGISSWVLTAVQAVASLAGPTLTATGTVTPSTIAAVASIGGPTVTAAGTVAPGTVHAVASIAAPTLTASGTTAPATVHAVATIGGPTVTAAGTVAPSTIAAVATVPAPTVTVGSTTTVSPATVTAITTVPGPTLTASGTVTPTTVTAVATLTASGLSTTANLAPATIPATATVGGPTVTATGAVAPSTVHAAATVATSTLTATGTAATATILAVAVVATSTVTLPRPGRTTLAVTAAASTLTATTSSTTLTITAPATTLTIGA